MRLVFAKIAFIAWVIIDLLSINAFSQEVDDQCLTITHYREANFLAEIPLSVIKSAKSGDLNVYYFALSFIHSVSLTPVVDYYQINHGKITQTAERFEHHGAGLPSNVKEGHRWLQKHNYFWLLMERHVEPLIIRTDVNYKNRLWLSLDYKKDLLLTENNKKSEHINDSDMKIDLNQWPDAPLLIAVDECHKSS